MYEIAFFILIPFIALLYEGLHRKLNARFQNRVGPPIIQPFYDMKKLFHKQTPKTENDPFFRSAPFLYFVSTYALFLFIPFSLVWFSYDFIFLIYLTILGSSFYVLAGLSSDNPFGIVGSIREMILMITYEITIAIIIFNFMIKAGALSFSALNGLLLPISAICLLIISLVELHITPFDTAEAPAEIMAGSETEYSGKNLAFFELAKYLKRLFFVFLLPLLVFGKNIYMILLWSIIFLFIYTLAQTTTSRYRVDQAFKVYFIVMIFALLDFILIMRGII